jgi:hypothetical protein
MTIVAVEQTSAVNTHVTEAPRKDSSKKLVQLSGTGMFGLAFACRTALMASTAF